MEKVTIPQGFRPPHCLPFIGNGTFQRNLWVFLFQRQHNLGCIHVHALGPVAGKNAGFHSKPPVCMREGWSIQENTVQASNALHSVISTTEAINARKSCIIIPKVRDRILLCRRHSRLRRLWRAATLHSCRVVLASPNYNWITFIVRHLIPDFRCLFALWIKGNISL